VTPRRIGAASLALVAAVALSACGDEEQGKRMPVPVPSDTPTALPDVPGGDAEPQVDPRCVEQYGAKAGLVYEGDIRMRPDGWPTPAEFAVLCWIETISTTEQAGHYATSYYTPYDTVLRFYEGALTAGAHGRADSTDGELLTGVLGDASFYIVETGTSRYAIHWAIDGEYLD
jgi:hypothetical protein